MQAKKLIKPLTVGCGLTVACGILLPKYTTIAVIGSGLYILYSVVMTKDDTAKTVSVGFTGNKIKATIKNPGKKPIAITTQIRLKDSPPIQEGMMRASTDTNRTTLIGEHTDPIIIAPGDTVEIEHDLLVPHEIIDSSSGRIEVKISFEDVKKAAIKAAETIAISKIDSAIKKTEETIITQQPAPVIVPFIEPTIETQPIAAPSIPTIVPPTIIEPETQISDIPSNPTIVSPPDWQSSEIQAESDLLQLITPQYTNVTYTQIETPYLNVSTDIETSRPIPIKQTRPGKSIGRSQTMLNIISSLDRLRSSQFKITDTDAI